MNRRSAKPHIYYWADDALSFEARGITRADATLVGWRCGSKPPLFVAVRSYLSVTLADEEAVELAKGGLIEVGWFEANDETPRDPDWILRPVRERIDQHLATRAEEKNRMQR